MSLDNIYQKAILEYASISENKYEIDNPTSKERGHNPNCGDDLTLMIKVDNNIIKEASFIGNGCAISTASTNILIENIKNQTVEYAKALLSSFFKMMSNKELSDDDLKYLQDAKLLQFASNMPARIKCATLSWHSLDVILNTK